MITTNKLTEKKLTDIFQARRVNLKFCYPILTFNRRLIINKKSQLGIQEMSFMLLAVFLFFVLVGLFVLAIVYSNIGEEAKKIAEERTLSSLTSLSDTSELGCISRSNCIDGDKLISLNGTIYQNFWPYSSLKVLMFSGFGKNEKELVECNFANYPNCDLVTVYDKKVEERAISSFVVLCRKNFENDYTYDKCELAKIIAGTKLETRKQPS